VAFHAHSLRPLHPIPGGAGRSGGSGDYLVEYSMMGDEFTQAPALLGFFCA
jgi:hypothetical protein